MAPVLLCPECGTKHPLDNVADVSAFPCSGCGRTLKVPEQARELSAVRQPDGGAAAAPPPAAAVPPAVVTRAGGAAAGRCARDAGVRDARRPDGRARGRGCGRPAPRSAAGDAGTQPCRSAPGRGRARGETHGLGPARVGPFPDVDRGGAARVPRRVRTGKRASASSRPTRSPTSHWPKAGAGSGRSCGWSRSSRWPPRCS